MLSLKTKALAWLLSMLGLSVSPWIISGALSLVSASDSKPAAPVKDVSAITGVAIPLQCLAPDVSQCSRFDDGVVIQRGAVLHRPLCWRSRHGGWWTRGPLRRFVSWPFRCHR
jgi:hypothetical protein